MMSRQLLYLDVKFWDQFVESFPEYLSFTDSSMSRMENYVNVFRFISSSHIQMNITAKELYEKVSEDDKLKKLWKKHTDGQCQIDFDSSLPKDPQHLTNEQLNTVYLLSDDKSNISNQLGIISIDISDMDKIAYLFKDAGTVVKGANNNWQFLSAAKHPFNTIVIIDPYILSDTDILEDNIFKILNILLPDTNINQLQISIISNDFRNDAKMRYEKVKKHIKRIRPNLNFSFTLYKDDKKIFHDRAIITNNIMITSGAGFALFNNNGQAKNSTVISIVYPSFNYSNSYARSSYLDIIRRAKGVHNETIDNRWRPGVTDPKYASCWGDGTMNRLLE